MTKPTGRPNGRPPFEPTEEQRKNVAVLVGHGIPERDICGIVRNEKDQPIDLDNAAQAF